MLVALLFTCGEESVNNVGQDELVETKEELRRQNSEGGPAVDPPGS
jgi:hypothetical protein